MPLTDQQNEDIQQIDQQAQAAVTPDDGGKPVKKPIGYSTDTINKIFAGGAAEGTTGIKQDIPKDLPFQPKVGQDNYLLRAQNQGWLKQTAKTVGNIIPNAA